MAAESFGKEEILIRVSQPLAGFRQKLAEFAKNRSGPDFFDLLANLFETCLQHAGEPRHAELFVWSVVGDQKNVQL